MTQDYKPGDNVIWTNPTNGRQFEATVIREVEPQGPTVSTRERRFEIKLQETGKTMTVAITQLRRANQDALKS